MRPSWYRAYGLPGKPTPRLPDEKRIPLVAAGPRDGETVPFIGHTIQLPVPRHHGYVTIAEGDVLPPTRPFETLIFSIHFWRPCWSAAPVPRYVQDSLRPTP